MRPLLHAHANLFRRTALVLGAALATGLGFALWMDKGARMFMALAETGMSWCF